MPARPAGAPESEAAARVQEPVLRRGAPTWSLFLLGGVVAALVGVGTGLGAVVWVVAGTAAAIGLLLAYGTQRGILQALVLAPFIEGVEVGGQSVGRLMGLAVLAVLGFRFATGRLRLPTFPPSVWLPAAGLLSVVLASGLWALTAAGWAFEVGQIALAVTFFAAFALLVTSPAHVARLLPTYVLGALGASAIGIAQALVGERAEGLQGDANIFALYQVAAVPAALVLARLSRGWMRAIWVLATLPVVASVFASESRGGLIALVAVLGWLAVTSRQRRVLVPLTVVGAGLALTLVSLLNSRYSVTRVSNDRASGRLDLWHVAWQTWLDHPWLGIGSGSFKPISIDLLTTVPGVELLKSHLLLGDGSHVHSIYLETLTELGVVGLAALLVFLGFTARNLLVAARTDPSGVVAALFPMFLAFCVAAVFLSILQSKLLWMLAGLAAAMLSSRATAEERPGAAAAPVGAVGPAEERRDGPS